MKAVGLMSVGCAVSWLLVRLMFAPEAELEIVLGMIMPLCVAGSTLVLAQRAYRRDPQLLTPLMLKAFVGKVVVFGVYVVVVISVLALKSTPFIVSFTAYFIVLHFFEAFCLHRLFGTTARH